MAVRKLDPAAVDARSGVTLKSDPTRVDPRKLKLGKSAARHDPRTLLLAAYVTPSLPNPPASFDLTSKVKSWGMMDNDQIGDCTCAAAGHMIMEWTANAGKKMVTPTDKQIVSAYSAITGYNPTTGANDNGAVEIDVLNFWRQSGIAGHKIGAYMALEPANHIHIMDSVFLFEGCYIGLQLESPAVVGASGRTDGRRQARFLGRTRRPSCCLRYSWRHGGDLGSVADDDLVVLGSVLRRSLRDPEQRLSDRQESDSTRFQLAAVAGGSGGFEVTRNQ